MGDLEKVKTLTSNNDTCRKLIKNEIRLKTDTPLTYALMLDKNDIAKHLMAIRVPLTNALFFTNSPEMTILLLEAGANFYDIRLEFNPLLYHLYWMSEGIFNKDSVDCAVELIKKGAINSIELSVFEKIVSYNPDYAKKCLELR